MIVDFPFEDMTEAEFTEAVNGLIQKGLAYRTVEGDKEWFDLTPFGKMIGKVMDSDPSDRN